MPKTITYKQCTMLQQTASASTRLTSYIPQQFAKLGSILRLRGSDGEWSDGWMVKDVGETLVDSEDLPDVHKAIRHHRKQTGDSTRRPKNK